jgi:hypothetical protein
MKPQTIIVTILIAAIVIVAGLFVAEALQGNSAGTTVSIPVGTVSK